MMINSNDIFSQIGFILSPARTDKGTNHEEILDPAIFLEIELGENQKHLLEVQYIFQYLDKEKMRIWWPQKFCHQHHLNKLAVSIIQQKIVEAKRQQRIKAYPSRQKRMEGRNITPENYLSKGERSSSITPAKQKRSTTKNDIYLRGVLRSRLQEEEKAKRKVEQDQKQLQELTFKPVINKVSEKIVEFLRQNNQTKGKKKSPPKKIYEELRECTFKPRINKVSRRLHENRSTLEQDRRREKQATTPSKLSKAKYTCDMENSQELFKPKINPKSSEQVTIPFFQRLDIALEKRSRALNKSQVPDEDQCSFHPRIGRAPRAARNKENTSVWEHLYNESKKQSQKQKELGKRQAKGPSSSQNSHSQNYYDNLIQERVKQAFSILDSDFDGTISPQNIGIEALPSPSLIFLKPIFLQMDSINATLDYIEFKRAVQALLEDSDPGTKGAFISQKWKKGEAITNEFRPTINKRSKELANNRSVENLYRDGLKEKHSREYRLEKERAIKEQKELEECSFKPSLNYSSKIYINKIIKKKEGDKNSRDLNQLINSFMNESQE